MGICLFRNKVIENQVGKEKIYRIKGEKITGRCNGVFIHSKIGRNKIK